LVLISIYNSKTEIDLKLLYFFFNKTETERERDCSERWVGQRIGRKN